MLLDHLLSWGPFRIDALGIVTLIGADQVDQAVGRLARNPVTRFLPLLGAYKIAGNDFVQPIAGFKLYNVTDGILATDLDGWFCRWLLLQGITFQSTKLCITVEEPPHRRFLRIGNAMGVALGIVALGPSIVLAVLMSDWWGLGNTVAMFVSVIVRLLVVGQNLAAIDTAASDAIEESANPVKIIVTMPAGEFVTVETSVGIVLKCLLTQPRPPHKKVYSYVRAIGWLAFGGHVVCLGQASLIHQLLAVVALVGGTVLAAWQVGDDGSQIGSRLRIRRVDHKGKDFRAYAMARMNLSQKEEDMLLKWDLFPQRMNTIWWGKFRECQADPKTFEQWDVILKKAFQSPQPEEKESHGGNEVV
ncbi:hypothetical protein ACHAPT_012357 [Fusarium lateritium]